MTKERLNRYLSLKREIAGQRERLARLASDLLSPALSTPNISGIRATGYTRNPLADGVEAKLTLEECIRANVAWLLAETEEIERAVGRLECPVEREIVRMRYIDGLGWDKVADKAGYEERQCYRIHNKALAKLADA